MQFVGLQNITGLNSISFSTGLDADAQAFLTAAGITDNAISDAINTLVTSLKSNSLWTIAKAIYPFVGGTAFTNKWNLRDTTTFSLSTVGSPSYSANGMLPGVGNYLDSNINDNTLTYNNATMGYYSRTNNTVQGADMGVSDLTSPYNHLWIYDSGNTNAWFFGTNTGAANTDTRGMYTVTSTASEMRVYKNGSSIALGGAVTNSSVGGNILIGSALSAGSGAKECAFSFVFDTGLNSAQVSSLYSIIQIFQTSLSRQV
jgi:hypothetical protein